MALATTTLSSAVAQTDTVIVVASAASMAAGRLITVDQEVMQCAQNYTTGTTIPVLRGRESSAQVAHKVTANVTHGLASDFATPGNQSESTWVTQRPVLMQSITATTSTLTLPPSGADLRLILNGTAAITLTIPVPTKDMDNCMMIISSNGVAQHILTFTGGLSGAGSSYDQVTINATAPASFGFIACNGLWQSICGAAISGTTTAIAGVIG